MRRYCESKIKDLLDGHKLLFVSCEAGAAEIVSSLILRLEGRNSFSYVLEGPAVDIFRKKLGLIHLTKLSDVNFKDIEIIVTGTSLVPELEREIIRLAKEKKIRVVSAVDHWVNYRQRFIPQNVSHNFSDDKIFPDEIWLSDDYAYGLAIEQGLPEDKLRIIPSFHFMDIQKRLDDKERTPLKKRTLLYICEPVCDDLKLLYGDGNIWGYNEFDLIDDLLASTEIFEGVFEEVVLRLHPNEAIDKYSELLQKYEGKIPIMVSNHKKCSIEEELYNASAVLGVESMALVIGLFLKKETFSYLPKSAKKKCALPHKEIIHVQSMQEMAACLNERTPRFYKEKV